MRAAETAGRGHTGGHSANAFRLATRLVVNDHGLCTSFATAVAGLTAAQAATLPAPRFNSVWAVVNH